MRLHPLFTVAGLLSLALLSACSRPEPAAEPVRAVRTTVIAPATAGGRGADAAGGRARPGGVGGVAAARAAGAAGV